MLAHGKATEVVGELLNVADPRPLSCGDSDEVDGALDDRDDNRGALEA